MADTLNVNFFLLLSLNQNINWFFGVGEDQIPDLRHQLIFRCRRESNSIFLIQQQETLPVE